MLFYSEFKEFFMVSAGDCQFWEWKYYWLLNSLLSKSVKQPFEKNREIPDMAKQKRNVLPHKIQVKSNSSVLKDERTETLWRTVLLVEESNLLPTGLLTLGFHTRKTITCINRLINLSHYVFFLPLFKLVCIKKKNLEIYW